MCVCDLRESSPRFYLLLLSLSVTSLTLCVCAILPDRLSSVERFHSDLFPCSYTVTEMTPPPRRLGLFRLEATAGCGDMIEVDDVSFVIRKVAYQYQYIGGAYRMVSKAAKVKKTSRDSVERFMERLLPKGSRDDKN